MSDIFCAGATLERVRTYHAELTGIRRDIHAHPELGLETHRTADIAAVMRRGRLGCAPTWTPCRSTSGRVPLTKAVRRV